MDDFKKEIENRFKDRKNKRSNTWSNLIIRILILIFLIMLIKQFVNSDGDVFHSFKNLTNIKSNTENVQENN